MSEGVFTEVYPGPAGSVPNGTPGAGVYGAELVGGRAGAQSREIYLGSNTGIGGASNRTEGEITWGSNLRPFTPSWSGSGLAINISGTDYCAPVFPSNTPLFANGNTLKIFVKGNATLQITSIDGGGWGRGIYIKHGNFAPPPAVPEPASWAMLIAGLSLVGATLRRRRPKQRPGQPTIS